MLNKIAKPSAQKPTDRNAARKQVLRTGAALVAGLFLAGTVFGYLLGLCQKIAQKQHRKACPACRIEKPHND